MPNILKLDQAANALRCDWNDPTMLDLLPLVDKYIETATGRDWAADDPVYPQAVAAARMLLVRWHEDPGGMVAGVTLGFGLTAALVQLEAIALQFYNFEGTPSAGLIYLPSAHAGDSVTSVTGVQGISGDQSASFETVISETGYIRQISAADLDDKWFRAHIVPVGSL